MKGVFLVGLVALLAACGGDDRDTALNEDAGNNDTSPTDAGNDDTSPTDAGNDDTSPTDAGNDDTSPTDAGNDDTSPTDAGNDDASPTDAGNDDTSPPDTTPDAFDFSAVDDVELEAEVESDAVTITGIDAETDISISGGEYAIDDGDYSGSDGTVEAEQSVTVRTTAPAEYSTSLDVVLTVGGVEGTFTVTTIDDPAPEAPVLELAAKSIKTFAFSWEDVDGESEYRLLENVDGDSDYTEIATLDANATEHDIEVFLPGRINASYILQACNDEACTDSDEVFVDTNLSEATGYIKASNAEGGDLFGAGVALSGDGNTLAVGATGEESNATGIGGDESVNDDFSSGAVYVFIRDDGDWSQQAFVKASNTGGGDQFGASLTLSDNGDTLAVGARSEASNATGIDGDGDNNDTNNAGAVYVFTREASTWSQEAYVKASNAGENDFFGGTVALSGDGDTLAVAAAGEKSAATGIDGDEDNNDADWAGAVYVFTREASTWSQQAYVKASNTEELDEFGYDMALSADGDTLAVGAYREDSDATGIDGDENNDGSGVGAVYVFAREEGTWSQEAYVKASNAEFGDFFGSSVALSGDGNTLAVGAFFEDSSVGGIDGDESDNDAGNSGAVYVFTREVGTWSQQAYIKPSTPDGNDLFGRNVALSADGDTLAVGTYSEDSDATGIDGDESNNDASGAGAVYVFTRADDTWSQQAYVKASNTAAEYEYSASVALSGDGEVLAVGSPIEASNATGIDGDQSDDSAIATGAVYLY